MTVVNSILEIFSFFEITYERKENGNSKHRYKTGRKIKFIDAEVESKQFVNEGKSIIHTIGTEEYPANRYHEEGEQY